jgi:hypothetical protein
MLVVLLMLRAVLMLSDRTGARDSPSLIGAYVLKPPVRFASDSFHLAFVVFAVRSMTMHA